MEAPEFTTNSLSLSFSPTRFFVTNRAQRCETHKLALFLVGGRVEVSRAVSVVAILIKSNTARDF